MTQGRLLYCIGTPVSVLMRSNYILVPFYRISLLRITFPSCQGLLGYDIVIDKLLRWLDVS